MEIISGKIMGIDHRGLLIGAAYDNIDRAILRKYDSVQIGLPDGRTISPEQRKKAHALISEIAEWQGDAPEETKRLLKLEFIVDRMEALERKMFSLSDCSVTDAREFITYLIDFVLRMDVPTRVPLYELCDDITKYVYSCLKHKKCLCCGQEAELHHSTAVGMGRNRNEIFQLGMMVQPICRIHHNDCHRIGQAEFDKVFHLTSVELTKDIGKVYGLSKKNLEVTYASEVG